MTTNRVHFPFPSIIEQTTQKPATIALALQGGGSAGILEKAVLEALLPHLEQRDDLSLSSVTGTSAGAVNAALLTSGMNHSGSAEALRRLNNFWNEIKQAGAVIGLSDRFNRAAWGAVDFWLGTAPRSKGDLHWATETCIDLSTRGMPGGMLPKWIAERLSHHIPDMNNLQSGSIKAFANAVIRKPNGTEQHVVYGGKQLTPQSVAASTALKATGGYILNGQLHEDGGYWRNPSLQEALADQPQDLIVIALAPPPPTLYPSTQDSWRAKGLLKHGIVGDELYHELAKLQLEQPKLRIHVIHPDENFIISAKSKMNTDPAWLNRLEREGNRIGMAWLAKHADKLGSSSSFKDTINVRLYQPQMQAAYNAA